MSNANAKSGLQKRKATGNTDARQGDARTLGRTKVTTRLGHQRGVALLLAMLTVALVATFAATSLWRQWGSLEVERAERQRLQVAWMLAGALDWSRLILREDNRKPGIDHLNEPWAMVLQEARLSTFLAADRSNTAAVDLEDALDAFLSGSIQDAQAKMNITNLIANGTIDPVQKASFQRLFDALGLATSELEALCLRLQQSQDTKLQANPTAVPLKPQRFRQLGWLGLSSTSLNQLSPFVTLLPNPTPVNLNTAPAEVLFAVVPGIDMAIARSAVQTRNTTPFASLEEAANLLGVASSALAANRHSVNSQYFFVTGRMRLDETFLQEVSLVQRQGTITTTLWREREVSNNTVSTGVAHGTSLLQ